MYTCHDFMMQVLNFGLGPLYMLCGPGRRPRYGAKELALALKNKPSCDHDSSPTRMAVRRKQLHCPQRLCRPSLEYQAFRETPLATPLAPLEPGVRKKLHHLLDMNKNTVQRIFQLKGWQVRKRAIGFRPRIQALPSVAQAPNERWSTDMQDLGRQGWLGDLGFGDRLPYP